MQRFAVLHAGVHKDVRAGTFLVCLSKDAAQGFRFLLELFRGAAADELHQLGVDAVFFAVPLALKGVAVVLQFLAVGFQLGFLCVQLCGGIVGGVRRSDPSPSLVPDDP